MKTPDLITTAEAARRLSVSQSWIQKRIAAGLLAAVAITGRLNLVDARDLAGLEKSRPGRKRRIIASAACRAAPGIRR